MTQKILFALLAVLPSWAMASYSSQITTLASQSACTQYSWKNRGRAPAGYVEGMALSFARSLCRYHSATPGPATIMSEPNTGNDAKDALAHYASIFTAAGIPINVGGPEALRALYTLGTGLGMRESSGDYCEGWDTSAGSHRPSSEGEAGLFQFSYNSIGAAAVLPKLYAEYENSAPRCWLSVYKQGASCRPQNVLGTGAGAVFQTFTKSCPSFAAEYAMTLLRVLRSHFGPIIRREAEVKPVCYSLYGQIQQLVEANLNSACGELF